MRAAVNRALGRLLARAVAGRPAPFRGLAPERDVERLGETLWAASSAEPWLRLELGGKLPAGRWIRLRYRAGRLADPVRPVLRIRRAGGLRDDLVLPGPVGDGAFWVGPLPFDAEALAVSPVAAAGRFAFALDEMTVLARPALLLGAFARDPGQTLGLIWQRLRGRRRRARHLLASVWGTTPLRLYPAWLSERAAPALPEPEDPVEPPRVGLLLLQDRVGDPAALARTLASLAGQEGGPWPSWVGEPRWPEALAGCDYLGVVRAGDALAPTALPAAAAFLARAGEPADLLYADEDRAGPDGRRVDPSFQPSWSPRLHREAPPSGLVLVRTGLARQAFGPEPPAEPEADLLRAALSRPEPKVLHLRRVLLHRGSPAPASAPVRAALATARPEPARPPSVSAVIPSRDRLDLLRRCVEGLRSGTDYPDLEIVIVDNGSEREETRAYYGALAEDPRVRVLERPGPFNYSALTNAGVAAAAGEFVLLLNNDIEVVRPGWLRLMMAEAATPDVGAVGAKLLYPDGRIQHVGVVIGLGGAAGHLYRGRADAGPGWAGRLGRPHEVSAVTGACLLVSRERYRSVGGLDEEELPISFNDIDLCLKLRAHGWRNLMVPAATLVHHESASRGLDVSGEKQARAERESRVFASRWLHVMRDDPYFHPALSLMRFDPALG